MKTQSISQQQQQAAYDAWYIAEVDKGIADADAGNVLTHEEAQKDIEKFMQTLRKKYAKKAA